MIFINKANSSKELQNIYLWGTGNLAGKILDRFGRNLAGMGIQGFIDNCRQKTGEMFYGYPIYTPEVLSQNKHCHVIILSYSLGEIAEQIKEYYSENVDRCESYHYFIKYRLLARYQESKDCEIKELLEFIKTESLQVFNYPFIWNYSQAVYEIAYDPGQQLFYTVFQGKKMYLSKRYGSREQAQQYLRQIMMEQDRLSPHCYLTDHFDVDDGSIVLDAGVAEGNFALSVIDKVQKIYLVEPDQEWAEALRCTFEPYMDKVVIVSKFLSDYQSEETVTVDSIVREKLDFIKMDIEGEEYHALRGAEDTIIRSKKMKCAICTYHNEADYINVNALLCQMGFQTKPSRGYMWFPYDKDYFVSLPSFRRGLIRAVKDK